MKVTDLRRKLIAALVAGGTLAPSAMYAADFDTNLVVNGDFEDVDINTIGGGDSVKILNWDAGDRTGFAYSHDGSLNGMGEVIPDYANGGPLAGGGSFYFTPNATPGDVHVRGQVTQLIDVSGGLSGGLINAGVVGYELSGFFSSYLTDNDYGAVNVEFLNSANVRIGENEINNQGDTSTWVQKMTTGGVPAGTATVRISIFGVRITGGGPDGYIDNVDFQLSATPPGLVAIVNRDTGNITIHNLTGSAENIASYSITSDFEALKPLSWTSITDNYDSGNPGPNQVDPAHAWSKLTDLNTHTDLSEADFVAGVGANLANNRTVNLGNAWIPTATEDLVFRYVSNGQVVTGGVSFIGNDNSQFEVGDLNTNGVINSADWAIFRANQHGNLSGLSLAEAYRAGDMNGDKLNNFDDFALFKSAYESANGGGSFAMMLSSIPEPSSIVLVLTSGLLAMPLLRRRQSL